MLRLSEWERSCPVPGKQEWGSESGNGEQNMRWLSYWPGLMHHQEIQLLLQLGIIPRKRNYMAIEWQGAVENLSGAGQSSPQSNQLPALLACTMSLSTPLPGVRTKMSELECLQPEPQCTGWATQQHAFLQLAVCSLEGPALQASEHAKALSHPRARCASVAPGTPNRAGERCVESRRNCCCRLADQDARTGSLS